jgi:hypothetical protein
MEDSAETSEPYHKWLDIPLEFCPPNHYVLLGVDDFSDDTSAIDAAAKSRTAALHQIAAGPDRKIVQRLLGEVAVARRTLLNEVAKAEYDAWLSTPEEDPSVSDAESFAVVSETKVKENQSPKSRKKQTVRQENADAKPATKRRRSSAWDSYKLHLLSASILACAVGVFAFMNRDGGRRASAVPKTSSSPAPVSQKFRQPAASKANPTSPRPATARKKSPVKTPKRISSGLSGPSGLDMNEFMKAGSTKVPQGGFASVETDTSSIPAPSEASKVKLPAKWWSGLKHIDVFGQEFDAHFPKARGKGKLFDAENGKLVLKPATGNDRYRRLTVDSKRLEMGEAVAIDTSLRPEKDSKLSLGLAIGQRVVVLQPTQKGISVKTKYDPFGNKAMHVANLRVRSEPANKTLFLIRDKKDATKIHWVLQTGASGLRGTVFAEMSEDAEAIQVFLACPSKPVNRKVSISNFRIGTFEKSPNWLR